MPEELPEIGPKQGHAISPDAFLLDLYRLICMVSAETRPQTITLGDAH
jgi:hypothetical protein